MSGPLLDVRHLSTHYVSARGTRVTRAVDDVSLVLDVGGTLGIVGESGSGKTTLALSLLRLLPTAARIVGGEIRFEGEDLLQKSDGEIRRIRGKRIAMILQDPMMSLNPLFTVGDQVAEPIRVHEGASRGSAWNRATELLKSVRIAAPESRVREYPHQLSGGMRQRIVGAIAISCEPRILIADEPTTSLDLTIQAQYLNLLRELQRSHNLVQRARAPVHTGAPRVHPPGRRQPEAAHRHRRPAAGPVRAAPRLRVPPALPQGHGPLPLGGAARVPRRGRPDEPLLAVRPHDQVID